MGIRRRKHKKAVLLVRNGNASYNTSEEMCNRMLFGFCFVDDDETTFFKSLISISIFDMKHILKQVDEMLKQENS